MILDLNIENFAIIDRISVSFKEGLNVITGETGTGKSIVVDAINLLLGERADRSFVRYGSEEATIEAVFQIDRISSVRLLLEKFGIRCEDDGTLLVSRQIYISGRSVARVNGRTVTVTMLREIVSKLIDIQGQNQNQGLVSPKSQMNLLDSLGGNRVAELRESIRLNFQEYSSIEKEIASLQGDEMEKERKMDLLRFQIEEIESANLLDGEEDELMKRYSILSRGEDVKRAVEKSIFELSEGDFSGSAILERLHSAYSGLNGVEELDEQLKRFADEMLSAYYQLQELSRDMVEYSSSMEYSSEELEMISSRIDLLNNLKRKYGNTIEEIKSYCKQITEDLYRIENMDREIEILTARSKEVYEKLIEQSKSLSDIRADLSLELEKSIVNELKQVNMKDSVFKVAISERESVSEYGLDRVEFMMSTNIGQPLKLLSKVASGGEMSRIMLSFKNVIAEKDEIATLIFDEIDAGISGRTAQLVGEKIYGVSKTHQIICITHLPQIAVMGDAHYAISKRIEGEVTTAVIDELDNQQKVDEITRLIGGATVTDTTRNHAKEMLELSERFK